MIEMLGKKFGRLTVLSRVESRYSKSGKPKVYWLCRCECGAEVGVQADCLRNGNTASCGCVKLELLQARHKPLLAGEVYGELTIIEEVPYNGKIYKYKCQCTCGKAAVVSRDNLVAGHTTTCGHKAGMVRGQHGSHPLYDIYMAMIDRATNPRSPQAENYSKRGVTVHPDWSNSTTEGFENFFKWATTVGGWVSGYHLDKEAVDHSNLVYGPDTCRFVPRHINAASSRKKSNGITSKFIGLHRTNRKKDNKYWRVSLMHKGEVFKLGYFLDERKAAECRDKFIKDNNLPHRLNFPHA